jgi:hypothetical protein
MRPTGRLRRLRTAITGHPILLLTDQHLRLSAHFHLVLWGMPKGTVELRACPSFSLEGLNSESKLNSSIPSNAS